MSEYERGSWATLAVVTLALSVVLLITGSDDWLDGVSIAGLMAYIVTLGGRQKRATSLRTAPRSDRGPNRGHLDDGNDERPAR